ncbi:ABC transporter permease [Psychrosphaera ytuae]|uniref:ABC transporter permease n=1 Tax=Psychrosphaera ytuae TaxID=2820710 RepID=A0A975HJA6_9GAMM|nr:ABC transporter permease [Psychrosphaera ytuae]QTH65112.1 ABC transporter permease [Psychrosphaera ytuae]
MFVNIAKQSLVNRKGTVLLTVLALTISIFVLLAVEHIRAQAKQSFSRTVSGVDLIVGPRTGPLNLLLGSVFRIGETGQAISWQTYQTLKDHPMVSWAAPIALGDSHKGHRVLATTSQYYEHFKYGNKQALSFAIGNEPQQDFDLVLGADIASKFNYQVGDDIVLSHGTGVTSFTHHDGTPFKVVGILDKTGTPVDQTLHINFHGLALMHGEEHEEHEEHEAHGHHGHDHDHSEHLLSAHKAADVDDNETKVSAIFVGLKARYASLIMQKWANDFKGEPISAILPGVALTQLWQIVGSIEVVLQVIAGLVLLTTLIGMSTMLLATMKERTREIAIFRTLGARPVFVFSLIQLEVIIITLVSMIVAVVVLWLGMMMAQQYLATQMGLFIDANVLTVETLWLLTFVLLGSVVIGMIPAVKAYKSSLHTSLQIKQ